MILRTRLLVSVYLPTSGRVTETLPESQPSSFEKRSIRRSRGSMHNFGIKRVIPGAEAPVDIPPDQETYTRSRHTRARGIPLQTLAFVSFPGMLRQQRLYLLNMCENRSRTRPPGAGVLDGVRGRSTVWLEDNLLHCCTDNVAKILHGAT